MAPKKQMPKKQVKVALPDGSQPSLPAWWPIYNNKPCQYLYRTMRPDGDDLRFEPHRAHSMTIDSDELRVEVLRSVAFGSQERSPFVHFSKSMVAPHRFSGMARANRNEEAHSQVFVRLDIMKMFLRGVLTETQLLDMSI